MEREYLEGLPRKEREEVAVWMWTAKEATLKATGQGLGAPLSSVIVTGFPGKPPKINTGDDTPWAVIPFRLGNSHLGSITNGSEGTGIPEVRIFTLEHELDRPCRIAPTTGDGILYIPVSEPSS